MDNNIIVYCDLDGVLADFEKGVYDSFGDIPLNSPKLWAQINSSKTFFENLEWMPKGKELWEKIKPYNPIILTGVPRSKTAKEQKINWCKRELGKNVKVITCTTKDKPKYCLKKSILIDDRTNNMEIWNSLGGKFILYHEDNFEEIIKEFMGHIQ
jgi:5'(3')-deoxyribonucleotidase